MLVIECKDVHFRKTYSEITEQLADFRGDMHPNGTRDELRKHLDRMAVIREHLNAVSRFTGVEPLEDVESHLMFKHPVPMEFALTRLAEKVTVSRFDPIAEFQVFAMGQPVHLRPPQIGGHAVRTMKTGAGPGAARRVVYKGLADRRHLRDCAVARP